MRNSGIRRRIRLAPAGPGWAWRCPTTDHLRRCPSFTVLEVLPGRILDRARRRWSALAQGAAYASTRLVRSLNPRKQEGPKIRLARYQNERGERLVGIIDSWGDTRGATAVVIAPAWGRTKETLLPLARTIVETFRAANHPVVVLRFDGIRKRGESHNDPDCLEAGTEHHHFTFSQGVRDISATLDFLERSPEFAPSKTDSCDIQCCFHRRAGGAGPRIPRANRGVGLRRRCTRPSVGDACHFGRCRLSRRR